MKCIASTTKYILACAITGVLAMGPAVAEKPEWSGSKGDRKERKEYQQREHRGDARSRERIRPGKGVHFDERNRVVIRDYYHEHYRSGRCPPGLRWKHNGCMPPGQIKRWKLGRVLPRDVIFYDVPPALVVQLGHPPAGYRYVRVASDILLIAIGTGLVIDAINDLGRMQ